MALMQIAEPGHSPNPHQKEIVLGIDLGTTHSLVASVKSAQPQCLGDDQGTLLASMVSYTANMTAVGEVLDPTAVNISSIKRFIGRNSSEVQELLKKFPVEYEWDFSQEKNPRVKTPQGLKSPVEISSEIILALKKRAIAHFGVDTINEKQEGAFKAVVTVPAYFDDGQRQATQDAINLAGVDVLRLINEPTAATLAFGIQNDGMHLVYDLGGGTFDVSLVLKNKDLYEVLATSGNTFLGGDDIDHELMQLFVARYPSLSKNISRVDFKNAKERLSLQEQVEVAGKLISRADLQEVLKPIVDQTLRSVDQVLLDADITLENLASILLVGGSTRSPLISEMIAQYAGQTPRNDVNPDEVVALGALAQARKMTSGDVDHLLLDVCPLSLGIETMGGIVEKIILRNTPIPVSKEQTFTTMKNNQGALKLHIVQGERESVEHCRSLAQVELRNLPASPAGVPRIQVRFTMDANGVLSVCAKELSSGEETQVQITPSQGLSSDEMFALLQESQQFGKADLDSRLLLGAKIELERVIEACDYALAEDYHLLDDEELVTFKTTLKHSRECVQRPQATKAEFNFARDQLNEVSETLAARRMDNAIKAALQGTYID